MSEYAADHPIEVLRGRSIPEPAEVQRTIAERIVWLEYRLKMQVIEGRKSGRELSELKAMLFVRKLLDDAYPPPESAADTEPPPAAPIGDAL